MSSDHITSAGTSGLECYQITSSTITIHRVWNGIISNHSGNTLRLKCHQIESDGKLTLGEKSLAAPGDRTCVIGLPVRRSTNWATSPPVNGGIRFQSSWIPLFNLSLWRGASSPARGPLSCHWGQKGYAASLPWKHSPSSTLQELDHRGKKSWQPGCHGNTYLPVLSQNWITEVKGAVQPGRHQGGDVASVWQSQA